MGLPNGKAKGKLREYFFFIGSAFPIFYNSIVLNENLPLPKRKFCGRSISRAGTIKIGA